MADIATLGLRVDADASTRQLREFSNEAERTATIGETLERTAKRVSAAFGVGFIAREVLKQTIDAQNEMARLEAAVRSTGGASGYTVQQLTALSESLAKVTTFSTGAVQSGLSRLLTYTGITGDMFRQASVAALDMAQALGIDVASAAERTGNALQYPSEAINSLTKQGFRFSDSQKRMIADFEESGQLAKAQSIILGELTLAYGGAANAARNTLGGALRAIVNDLGSLAEVSRGGTSGVVSALNRLDDAVRGLREHMDTALTVVGAVATIMAGRYLSGVLAANAATIEMRTQVALGNAVMLDSVQAQRGAAAAAVARAEAERTSTASIIAGLEAQKVALREAQIAERERLATAAARVKMAVPQEQIAVLGGAVVARDNAAVVIAMRERAQAQEALVALSRQAAATDVELAAAARTLAVAEAQATAAMAAQAEVIAATTLAARAGAAALGVLRSAYLLIGGLPGVLLIAAYGAYKGITTLRQDGVERLAEAARKGQSDITKFRDSIASLGEEQLRSQLAATKAALDEIRPKALTLGLTAPTPEQTAALAQYANLLRQLGLIQTALEPIEKRHQDDLTERARKFQEALAQSDIEIARQRALNGAFGQSKLALALLNNEYDARADRAKNAVDHTAAETAALNRRTDAMKRAKDEAARLDAAEEARAAAQKADDDYYNAQNDRVVKAINGAAATKRETEQILAMVEATKQGKDAVDALTIAQAGENAVIAAGTAVMARDVAAIRKAAEDHARAAIALRDAQAAEKTATKEVSKAAEDAARADERRLHEVLRTAGGAFQSFFMDVFENGKGIFQSLWDAIKQGFARLITDLLAMKLEQKLAGMMAAGLSIPSILPNVGVGVGVPVGTTVGEGGLHSFLQNHPSVLPNVGAGLAGFGIGYGTQNAGMGALGGAAAGFAVGGPLGAVVGGLSGLAGGLFGASKAAKEAAERLKDLWNEAGKAAVAFHEQTINRDSFETAKAAIDKQFRDIWSGLLAGNGGKLPAGLHDVPDGLRTAQTRASVFQQAIDDYNTLIAKAKEAADLQLKQTNEDLQVRLLAAQGRDKEAAALKLQLDQEREREAMLKSFGDTIDPAEAATLSLLDQVQAQEKLKAATDAANKSALNMVEGYNLQRLVFQNASAFSLPNTTTTGGGGFSPSGGHPTPVPTSGPSLSSSTSNQPVFADVTLMLDGKVLARVTKQAFKRDGQQQFGDTTRWGETA